MEIVMNSTNKMPQGVKNKIIEMWNAGKSAGVIGLALGVTRNTVVGQVHRMRISGIELRTAGVTEKRPHVEEPKPEPKPIAAPISLAAVSVLQLHPRIVKQKRQRDRWVPLLSTKSNTCRYTKDGKTFCNHVGHPYCETHRELVYVPMRVGRR